MCLGEEAAMAFRLDIYDKIDVTLAIQRDGLGAMTRHGTKAHVLKKSMQLADVGGSIFDEFESIRSDWVFPKIA